MRAQPNVVKSYDSPNKSGRGGVTPRLIVLHSTESHERPGNSDLEGVASWLCNPQAQASSHVIVDGDGNSARVVADEAKAWTCAAYNRVSLNIEQVGQAAQSRWVRPEVREAARWVARWSIRYGIPIQIAHVKDGGVLRPGVTRHMDLGQMGGGHHDPGDAYPFRLLLGLARYYRYRQKRGR